MTSRRGAGMNSEELGRSTDCGRMPAYPNIYGDWRQRSGVGDGGSAHCSYNFLERRMAVRMRPVMRCAFRIGAFQRSLQVILIAFLVATASTVALAQAQAQATKLDDLVS